MTTRPDETREQRDARLEGLLIELIDAAEVGGRERVDAFLARHPDEAGELREHLAALSQLELLEGEGADGPAPPFDAVDDFRLLKPLGRGGMGEVWLAEQTSLRRAVAVKVIRAGADATGRARERFRREARAMALVDHPNAARVLGSGTRPDGIDWIAMEYVPGRGLDEIYAEARRDPESLDSRRLVGWGVEIASALQCAHDAGVVHRDVKPSNVRIRPDGRAVVIDFGLSRHLYEGTLSLTGDFIGSPHYAAPEQLAGVHGEVGPATDVYALGLTLYEGFTGLRPFEGESTEEVFRRILQTDPPRPRALSSRVTRDLETVLLMALRKEPSRRYGSAAAMARDLSACLEGGPVAARPESRVRRGGRWMRRHPGRSSIAAVALLALAATGGILWKLPEITRIREEQRHWDVDAAVDEGYTLQSVGLLDDARARFLRALDLDSDDRDAMAGYALVLLESRRREELYSWLDERDRARPGDRFLALIRRMAMNIHGEDGPKPKVAPPFDAVESFFIGHIALAAGDGEKAMELLQDANLIVAESRPPYVFDLIQAAVLTGRTSDAKRYLKAARVRWPGHRVADFIEASLVSRDDPGRAVELLEGFLETLPRSPSALMNLGLAHFRGGDAARAVDALRRGLALDPDRADMRADLGEILYRTGRVDEAIAEFETAVADDAGCRDAWYGLGHCLLVLKDDPAAALGPLRHAVELDAADGEARERLRLAALWTGSWEDLLRAAGAGGAGAGPDVLRACVERGAPGEAADLLGGDRAGLARRARRWQALANGGPEDALDLEDRLALVRTLRARGELDRARRAGSGLELDGDERREAECRLELARTEAAVGARDDDERAWRRALDHLDAVYELWTAHMARTSPRPTALAVLAPVFDAAARARLPAPLRDRAAALARTAREIEADERVLR